MENVKIIKCKTGLPETVYFSAADFPGDKTHVWADDTVFRIVCSKCGLLDKSGSFSGAEIIKNKHKH